jgi:arginase
MRVEVIQVPYDSGHRGARMGAGPLHFVRHGLEESLRAEGHDTHVRLVEAQSAFCAEIKTAIELCRLVADEVRKVRARGDFPLVLSGNCNSSLGTLAGVGTHGLGMIWFDAHGDFNTPETKESTFFDGMGMAIATEHCWTKLAKTIPGFSPLRDANVIHAGGRDFDPEESVLLERSDLGLVRAEQMHQVGVREALEPALSRLLSHAQRIYLHLDLDVLDPEETPANQYALKVSHGLRVEQVEEAVKLIGERFEICAAGVAAYDPSYDPHERTLKAGLRIIKTVLTTKKS